MIAFLTGTVARKTADAALLDVGGVGFRLIMSTRSLTSLPAEGGSATVHTFLQVREDELTLYGFAEPEERDLFEHLIAVNGVGPKVAIAVLSSLRPDALRSAVANDDVALLGTVPGIGKKTAARLILELKDKLGAAALAIEPGAVASLGAAEARDALLSMGFSSAEAAAALRGQDSAATAEELLKGALRRLGGSR